jgi:2-dehydro-3-deoxy-D-arabinonate dehydratase
MKLYQTRIGPVVEHEGRCFAIDSDFDSLLNDSDLHGRLATMQKGAKAVPAPGAVEILPPIGNQEVWAAGVTYYRSRDARIEESQSAGGGDFYVRVYEAPRPELFFKSAAWRVVGTGDKVRIRKDSKWNVPEPELALVINARGRIIGYTIGNDMSSRDIEGENPLYLPQAKVYNGACAIGPAIWVTNDKPSPDTAIAIQISRGGKAAFEGSTKVSQIKRPLEELVEFLYRETSFPKGCILLTGTGVVPPSTFTLDHEDRIDITIDNIGTLSNSVE